MRPVLAAAFALGLIGPAAPASAFGTFPVPNGYTITSKQWLSSSLVYVQYRSKSPLRVVNVAFLKHGGPEHFRMVVSGDRIAGPKPWTETISSMCKRVGCKIAVNGDFFSNANGQPAGGVAAEGAPLRTPPDARYHFYEDWNHNTGVRKISLAIRLNVTYAQGVRSFYVHSINTARGDNRAVVYSPRWGPSSETASGGFELVLRLTNAPLLLDRTANVTITGGAARGNTPVPSDGLVLSGSAGEATEFSTLWRDVQSGAARAQATMSFDNTPDLRMYVGGTPALLLGGKQAFTNDGSSFMNTSDPHTMLGKNSSGDSILAVVDGRQPGWSVGFTVPQEAAFMRSLGAVEALNVDGGGSSEFVKKGVVTDRPSDGRERPIAAALTIV